MSPFSLTPEKYAKIYNTKQRIQHHIFTQHLNANYKDIPCVLKSVGGYTRVNGLLSLIYHCSHPGCTHKYKAYHEADNRHSFTLYRNNVDVVHEEGVKIVPSVRGSHREEVLDIMATMTTEQYLVDCEAKADKELVRQGNLQEQSIWQYGNQYQLQTNCGVKFFKNKTSIRTI